MGIKIHTQVSHPKLISYILVDTLVNGWTVAWPHYVYVRT